MRLNFDEIVDAGFVDSLLKDIGKRSKSNIIYIDPLDPLYIYCSEYGFPYLMRMSNLAGGKLANFNKEIVCDLLEIKAKIRKNEDASVIRNIVDLIPQFKSAIMFTNNLNLIYNESDANNNQEFVNFLNSSGIYKFNLGGHKLFLSKSLLPINKSDKVSFDIYSDSLNTITFKINILKNKKYLIEIFLRAVQ